MRRAAALVALAAGLVLVAGGLAGTAAAVTLVASQASVPFGSTAALTGSVPGASAGTPVTIEREEGGAWLPVAAASTDAAGGFAVEVALERSATLRAVAGASSDPVAVAVEPVVELRRARGRAFVGVEVRARVRPADFSGRVTIALRRHGRTVSSTRARVHDGRVVASVGAPGPGRYTVVVRLAATDGLAETELRGRAEAGTRPLSVGSEGDDVVGLLRRLAALRYHVPAAGRVYTVSVRDAVYAFQKANGLERTGSVDIREWRRLAVAATPKPRFQGPSDRIEVDKTRQILLKIRDGEVIGVVAVSTGATGNTPEGRHRIRWKAPATTTWLGPAILYRTLTFVGDRFAIHGFPSVPPYPASHGCVRVPIWAADWLYQRSPVGEAVFVYR